MKGYLLRSILGLTLGSLAAARPAGEVPRAAPSVTIADGTVIGSTGVIENFAGIPFADAPVGPLRLKPPQKLSSSFGTLDGSGVGPACPQFIGIGAPDDLFNQVLGDLTSNPLVQAVADIKEDCLTMRIQRPVGTAADAKLPVLFYIFGGGFELGSPQMYDGTNLILQSLGLGKPFIFVAVNYRVGGFGFLGGKEILADNSANLGLLDQRLGLQWVADNIAAFGGDPEKVTIWGESAGAISVLDQMVLYDGDNTYNGQPLFRGAIMNSGSVIPANPVDDPKSQDVYDQVVREAGCAGASDTLECLREADYDTFLDAANSVPGILSYNSVALAYLPRPDGTALSDSPELLVESGKYAGVPMIIGDQEDEGTLFALFQTNITTTDLLVDYLQNVFFPNTSRSDLEDLVATYPDNPSAGSPFRTGIFNNPYPQFKRLAAILGDLTFTLTRRAFLEVSSTVKPDIPSWSYLSSYDYGTPILGTGHGTDILQVIYGIVPNYASASFANYYISFLYDLDPNTGSDVYPDWPQWSEGKQLQWFTNIASTLLADDFRSESYEWIAAHTGVLRI